MKKIIQFLLVCLLPFSGIAQHDQTTSSEDSQNMKVVLQQEAHYPGGQEALFKYIYENIKYPEMPESTAIIGEVFLSFTVGADSTLGNISVISGVGHGVDEEVINVLKPLKYAPSIQNGVKLSMNVMLTVPIRHRTK